MEIARHNNMSPKPSETRAELAPAFQSAYPLLETNPEFAAKFFGNLMGGEAVPAALLEQVVDLVVVLLNGGMSRGALAGVTAETTTTPTVGSDPTVTVHSDAI